MKSNDPRAKRVEKKFVCRKPCPLINSAAIVNFEPDC